MIKRKSIPISKDKGGKSRPPVVAILGHVDHGKTTLLSKIKEIDLTKREHGGISQHIGAYQVSFTPPPTTHNSQPASRLITFIDTPGHAAFSQMRSRGAKVADLVVLVVAVDEGVKPQTLESLKHIQLAKIPYLVALTKIDLPNTNIERVKKDLGKNGVMVEGHGGDVVVVPVSGKTGEGVKELLEMVLILAEMAELKGSPDHPLKGVVIESKLDSRRGPLATILVRDGSLKVGSQIEIEKKISRVRAMLDENGKRVSSAGPATPVEILGFKEIPPIGAKVTTAEVQSSDARHRDWGVETQKPSTPTNKARLHLQEESSAEDSEVEMKRLKIVLKADTAGSLEAVVNSLPTEIQLVDSGVGAVSESDVLLAEATGAQIVAFNVKVSRAAKKLAEAENVKVLSFKVIYELLKEIEEKALKLLEPTIGEKVLGRAEILKEFNIKKERIAGCQVVEGRIRKIDRLHLLRKGKIIGDCRIDSMKSGKEDIEEAKKGVDFGAILSPPLDFVIGDMLVSFHKVEEP